jgi:hypothetical protein
MNLNRSCYLSVAAEAKMTATFAVRMAGLICNLIRSGWLLLFGIGPPLEDSDRFTGCWMGMTWIIDSADCTVSKVRV